MSKDEEWLLEEKYAGQKTPAYEVDRHRLAAGEPVGYVIGSQPFLGLKIFLDSKPLIPRPETEWWVERLIEEVSSANLGASASDGERHEQISSRKLCVPQIRGAGFRFLDLCAGSGAIGCAALARLPQAHVYFGEIDPAHEATILKNISENHLDASRADVRIGDLFEPFDDMQFDVIAANPPYVPTGRILPASVADYEPAGALLAGEDGLDVIRRIAASLRCHLTENGVAWVECDTAHAEDARALFTAQGLTAKICNDQYGKPRIIVVSFH